MEVRISDLLAELDPAGVEIKNSNMVSAEKIKEMTMNKIRGNKAARPRVTRTVRVGLVAALFALLLGISVGAYRGFVHYEKNEGEGMLSAFFGQHEAMSGDRIVEYETVEIEGELYERLVTNIPAWQRMPISEELMEKLSAHIGAVEESVSYGGYTLTVEACLYDANIGGGLLYYSVENPDGLDGYKAWIDGEISWPGDSPWFVVVGQPERSFIDTERSTETKIYVCSHFTYVEEWEDFVVRIGTGDERTDRHSAGLDIQLYDTGMPSLSFADEKVKLSHIGLWVDKQALGLRDGNDIDRIIVRFADGSEFVAVQDEDSVYISNLAYALDRGLAGGTTHLFNSVIDLENVVEIQIEDMVFKIE